MVSESLCGDDLQVDFRMTLAKRMHARNEPEAGKRVIGRKTDGRTAASGAQAPLQAVHLCHGAFGDRQQATALVGEAHASVEPLEKRQSGTLLQKTDLIADGRLTEAERLGGGRQRTSAIDLDQKPHPGQIYQLVRHRDGLWQTSQNTSFTATRTAS